LGGQAISKFKCSKLKRNTPPLPISSTQTYVGWEELKKGAGVLNFEFWSFGFVWDLGFVIWDFNPLYTLHFPL